MASHPQTQPGTGSRPGARSGSQADPRPSPKPGVRSGSEADPRTGSRAGLRIRGFGGGNDEFGDAGAGSERVGSGAGSAVGPRSGSRAGSGAGSVSAVAAGGGGGGWEWHADRIEAGFTALNAVGWSGLPRAELVEVMAKLTSFKASSDGLLCAVTAAVSSIEGKADAAETLRQQSHMSLHDARRFERVGSQLADMPNTSQQLSSGEITLDHATEMAKAAELVGAAAVDSDDTLLESAGSLVAERFAQQVKTWTRDRLQDRGADLHQTQRHRRRGLLFVDKSNGMGVLHTEFDEIAFGLIRQAVDTRAQAMLNLNTTQAADGLDGPVDAGGTQTLPDVQQQTGQRQLRNLTQCRADAVFELVTGRSADTPHPPIAGETARAGTQLLIVADIGVIDGTNPAGRCEIIGTGAVPPTILTQLSPDTKLAAMIFDGQGQPLWLGRSRRHHNTHQYLAVAARDAGCVECRAPMHLCDIHHTKPWSQGGPTDIDNLVALCSHHHRQTHTTNPTSPNPASLSRSDRRAQPDATGPLPASPSPDTYQQPLLC